MKKIAFLTGTRADFGKIKSLFQILQDHPDFEAHIFVTGMHLIEKYGYTLYEIEKCRFRNIFEFVNETSEATMDLTLAKTIEGLSSYVKKVEPDLIVVHGDRVETLAGAIVGSLNNILVAHIEGGEISGTVDELLRHSVSKLSHIHFVSNQQAERRLVQMGEIEESIFVIGSPDVDIMFSGDLPEIKKVKDYYAIPFQDYAIAMFHPVTTESKNIQQAANNFITALLEDKRNYVVIYPNNDLGSSLILKEYERLRDSGRFRIIPSLRFEYFLTLLKCSEFIIGNSSAGIREAPYYGIPVINVGSRQNNRSLNGEIINTNYSLEEIKKALQGIGQHQLSPLKEKFGEGNSAELFVKSLESSQLWEINHQKQFRDL